MSNFISEQKIVFHLSLNVSDISRSVEFFSKVFGLPPAKQRADYAKFELQNPPLTLSLEPGSPGHGGSLNHIGLKLTSAEQLVEYQRRLETAGISSQREEGVECCYAKQTKFWLHDPDGNLWEMYVLGDDIEHRGSGRTEYTQSDSSETKPGGNGSALPVNVQPISCAIQRNGANATREWSHRLGQDLVIPQQYSTGSLDSISLQGTFNGADTEQHASEFLVQACDRLADGGQLSIHCLTADRPLDAAPTLSGPASVVKTVPNLSQLIDQINAAGFEAVELTKFGARACFTVGSAELRETRITARKPFTHENGASAKAIYKGPFKEIRLADGTTMPQGKAISVSRKLLEPILSGSSANSILILETATEPVACGS